MERVEKLELIQRVLGIRHKLKVHESMKAPETHEDLALTLLAKWELEDELRAIEELLNEERTQNVGRKRKEIIKNYLGPGSRPASEENAPASTKKVSKGTKKPSRKS